MRPTVKNARKLALAMALIGGLSSAHAVTTTCTVSNLNAVVTSVYSNAWTGAVGYKAFSIASYVGGPSMGNISLWGSKNGVWDMSLLKDLTDFSNTLTQAMVSGFKVTQLANATHPFNSYTATCDNTPVYPNFYPGDNMVLIVNK